jgi:hypothetical protein
MQHRGPEVIFDEITMTDTQPETRDTKSGTRLVIRLLTIGIPSIATVFGLVTWFLLNFGVVGPTKGDAPPSNKVSVPVTQQEVIPELPYDDINNGLYTLDISVACESSSKIARWSVSCSDDSGYKFEPCFYPATDGEPYSVYCFDPVKFKYSGFSLSNWASPSSSADDNVATASYIFIRLPGVNNVYDYAPETISIGGWQYDVCSIVVKEGVAPENSDYLCVTGNTVVGGIQGERPHYFGKYLDKKTGTSSVEWIGWIVYG